MTAPLLVIADDDANMRTIVREALRPEYPDAIEVADGRELFWQLLRASFRVGIADRDLVIVTDIRMPAYSGLDVLDAWHDSNQVVPVVVITSFPDHAIENRVARLQAQLLAKPFTRGQLRHAVREAAATTRAREVGPA